MTCEECERWQEEGKIAYYRVDVANVGITGCLKHIKAVMDTLRAHTDELTRRAKE